MLSISRFIVISLFPSIATKLGLSFINKKSEKFFVDVCKKIVEQRRAEKADHRDIMDNLMKVAEDNPELTEEMMFKEHSLTFQKIRHFSSPSGSVTH